MSEVPTKPLVELCRSEQAICYGIVQPGRPVSSGVPIVRVNNFRGHSLDLSDVLRVDPEIEAKFSRSRPRPGDLLVSLVGTLGQVAIAPPEIDGWNIARAVGLIPIRDTHHAEWLYFALQSPEAQRFIQRHANTTVQATFNLRDLAALPVPYPEQGRREAALRILSSLQRKIELNRRMNETLETMAQAIFRDWFVDFGPTRRKLAGITDPVEIMGGLVTDPVRAAKLVALFPRTFGDNGLPQEWNKGVLGDIAKQVGESVSPDSLSADTPYIGLEHMPRRSLALDSWDGAGTVISGKLSFKRGDFLFGKLRPYFHKVGIAPVDGICSTDIVVLNSKDAKAHSFVITCISQDTFVAFTDRTSDGTKMPRTSWGRMACFELPLPTPAVFQAFDNLTANMFEKLVSNTHQARTLAATRDLLLPKLMSGEIRLRDAEAVVEEAT